MSDYSPPGPGQTQLIEASAGTGKTHTITDLCLQLLLGRDGRPPLAINQLLILTFTRAATAELRDRINRRIHEARRAFRDSDSDDEFLAQLVKDSRDADRDRKLLTAAGQLMDEASIFTIHGFCNRVLGDQAFESGLLFDQEVNAERAELLKLAAEDCFRNTIMTRPEGVRETATSIWPNPSELAGKFEGFLFRGELELLPPRDENLSMEGLVHKAKAAKAAWLEGDLEALLRDADLHKGRSPFKNLGAMTAFCRSDALDLQSDLWSVYGQGNLAKSLKKDAALPAHPALDLIDEVHRGIALLKSNLWHEVRTELDRLLQRDKAERGKLTLDDLLTRLETAVNKPGSRMPAEIAARWPVAMIDEFQDTDLIQDSIFSRVYPNGGKGALLMIGDPKQAIYAFRGADVYSYINARRRAAETTRLEVNWRSSPALVEATNSLFDKPDVFGTDMPFHPVSPAPRNERMQMTIGGAACKPCQIFVAEVRDGLKYKSIRRDELLERLMAHAAGETVTLLDTARLDGRPVTPGQIAFLVRTGNHARAAQRALAERGIQSAFLTLDSVFREDTASDLGLVLEAILEPGKERSLRAALATRLMQCTARELADLGTDISRQRAVLAEFGDYHRLWQEKGIAPMLNTLIRRRGLAEKWLGQREGYRQLTNLRHLTEILQQQAAIAPGMYQLLKWFSREQRQAERGETKEERQLRLESDEKLVQIVTMHAAKGLEYDIVMLPMPVFQPRLAKGLVLFHEERQEEYAPVLEIADDESDRARVAFDRALMEQKEENMRLLYVAMTRARYRCYIGLPRVSKFPETGIAKLTGISTLGNTDSLREAAVERLPTALFEVVGAGESSRAEYVAPAPEPDLTPPPEPPPINGDWRMHSYSGITASLAALADPPDPQVAGYSDDDPTAEAGASATAGTPHTFPRGPRVGLVLHSLLEEADFRDKARHPEQCARALRRLGLPGAWQAVMTSWLADILNAPLGGFSLADLDRRDRLDEMEFHFPVNTGAGLVSFLASQRLLPASDRRGASLEGMMTGRIDLLFRHDGRYYIADYKSNWLGGARDDYTAPALEDAMTAHRYHLQYHIYTVAVTRMLKRALPGFDYGRHFGGVWYLFLRGMGPRDPLGVWFEKPDEARISELDRLLGGRDG